jgi:hypothetical protein
MPSARQTLCPLARWPFIAAALMALLGHAARAGIGLHESDIILRVTDARITTWAVDTGATPAALVPARLFLGDFAGIASTADPGFDTEPFTFAPGTQTGFDLPMALRRWNGTAFEPVSSPVVRVRLGPSLVRYTPPDDTPVTGFGLTIGANGLFHRHYTFTLLADAQDTPVGPWADGVYAMAMRTWNTGPGIAPSETFFILFSQNAPPEQVAAASASAASTLLGPAPCNPADIAATDSTPGPDAQIDNGDFALFVASFFADTCTGAVPCAPADIAATDSTPGPDGQIDNGDFALFISAFFTGCG